MHCPLRVFVIRNLVVKDLDEEEKGRGKGEREGRVGARKFGHGLLRLLCFPTYPNFWTELNV
jgi:hypothetical protein